MVLIGHKMSWRPSVESMARSGDRPNRGGRLNVDAALRQRGPHMISRLRQTALSSPLPAGAKRLVNLFHLKDDRSGTRDPHAGRAEPERTRQPMAPLRSDFFFRRNNGQTNLPESLRVSRPCAVSLPKFPKASGLSGRCSSTSAFPNLRGMRQNRQPLRRVLVCGLRRRNPRIGSADLSPVRKAYLDAPDSPDHLCGDSLKPRSTSTARRSAVLHRRNRPRPNPPVQVRRTARMGPSPCRTARNHPFRLGIARPDVVLPVPPAY